MKVTIGTVGLALVGLTMTPALAGTLKCPPDSVKVGNVCIDAYEASVWQIDPVAKKRLANKVQAGKATLADLTAGGATLLSPALSCTPGYPGNFPAGGQWTPVPGSTPPSPGVYAVSIAGVLPSACIDWFQAAQACRLSGKRLATNLEWQDAAAGTPDPGNTPGPNDCNTKSAGVSMVSNTGSRTNCKSSWGAFDMIGNVIEWVADWANLNTGGSTNSTVLGLPGGDDIRYGGDGSPGYPAALVRGGVVGGGTGDGVFMVDTLYFPGNAAAGIGFRCAR